MGPRILPCRIEIMIFLDSDKLPFMSTFCVLLEKAPLEEALYRADAMRITRGVLYE
jgi:hypothetical protein